MKFETLKIAALTADGVLHPPLMAQDRHSCRPD